jgi:hypothetical protein
MLILLPNDACASASSAKMTALELAKHNIRVNVVCPGQIETAIEQSMQTRNLGEIELPVKYDKGTIPLVCAQCSQAARSHKPREQSSDLYRFIYDFLSAILEKIQRSVCLARLSTPGSTTLTWVPCLVCSRAERRGRPRTSPRLCCSSHPPARATSLAVWKLFIGKEQIELV